MSPLSTVKFSSALEKLIALGLVPSAVNALQERGSDAVYAELSKRGYVWSPDGKKWRKSLKPRKNPIIIVKTGYLDHTEVRLIVRSNEYNQAIEEFEIVMRNAGYEVTRVTVHTSRNPGDLLVYAHIHQNGRSDG